MTKPEIDAVRDWLTGAGYPLEYETAREMARVGYRPWRGRYYKDPATGEHREIDVLVTEPDSLKAPLRPVSVIAECKHNTKPWLVLTDRLEWTPGYGGNFVLERYVPVDTLVGAATTDASFLLTPPVRFGYGIAQTMGGPDTPFAALQTVVKAARHQLTLAPRSTQCIAIPIIVIDGSLYQLGFEDDGSEVLEPVLWQRVVWHGSSRPDDGEPRPVQVDIVKASHLPEYLQSMRRATRALAGILTTLPAVRPH